MNFKLVASIPFMLLFAIFASSAQTINNYADLQACVTTGWNAAHNVSYTANSVTTCQLQAGTTISVSQPVTITLTNAVYVLGITNNVTSVTLQRAADIPSIMTVSNQATSVFINWLTFDGNRFSESVFTRALHPSWYQTNPGTGLTTVCQPANSTYSDLEFESVIDGTVTVQHANFIRAPSEAVRVGGSASTISYSTFAASGTQDAARSTAIQLGGSHTGVYYSDIYYAGTAAITVHGPNSSVGPFQIVYGNTLGQNRYELPDGSGGGQLFVDNTSLNPSIAANVINGNWWQAPSFSWVNGCQIPASPLGVDGMQKNAGIESNYPDQPQSHSQFYYNNEVEQHTDVGMVLFGPAASETTITISGYNPWVPSDAPKYVENNVSFGIWVYAPLNLALDHIRSINNGKDAINFNPGVSGGFWPYQWGPQRTACLSATGGYNEYYPTSGLNLSYFPPTIACP